MLGFTVHPVRRVRPWQALLWWCFARCLPRRSPWKCCKTLPLLPVLCKKLPLRLFSLNFLAAESLEQLVPLSRWTASTAWAVDVAGNHVVHAIRRHAGDVARPTPVGFESRCMPSFSSCLVAVVGDLSCGVGSPCNPFMQRLVAVAVLPSAGL